MRTVLVIAACMLHTSAAYAVGSTWSEKANARIVHERQIVFFDPDQHTEHLVVQVRFQTDAKDHAVIVPMPAPTMADRGYGIEDEIVFARLESLVRYDDPKNIPDAPDSTMLPQTTARTAQGTVLPDASALDDWLKLEKLPERPSLTQWGASYVKSGWALNAVRISDDDSTTPTRIMQSPPLRFSFPSQNAYIPYRESPPEKSGSVKGHSLDVWVVTPRPATVPALALERRSTTRISSADLEASIGKIGSFDPRSRSEWIITRFAERGTGPRVATDDLAVVQAGPIGGSDAPAPKHGHRKGWLLLVLGLAAAIGFAIQSQQDKKR